MAMRGRMAMRQCNHSRCFVVALSPNLETKSLDQDFFQPYGRKTRGRNTSQALLELARPSLSGTHCEKSSRKPGRFSRKAVFEVFVLSDVQQ